MHLLTTFSLKNRALIALVTIVAAVFGTISVTSLKQELMPSVQYPVVAVITSYPGASPDVVNNDVSEPIETALRGVSQLEGTTATSGTGTSTVVAEFAYGVDLSVTEQRVERAVSRISAMLPDSVDTQVVSGGIDDFPVVQLAATPGGDASAEDTAQLLERVAVPELEELDDVREAQISGAREMRVTITPDEEELADAGVTRDDIVAALQHSGSLIAAGTVTEDGSTLAVQAGEKLESVADIESVPLPIAASAAVSSDASAVAQSGDASQLSESDLSEATGGSANVASQADPEVVTIGDLAKVALEPGPQESISRVNGSDAVTIAVTKVSSANTVEVSQQVQQTLDDLSDQLDGTELTVVFDQAPYIERSVHTLTTEGMLGLAFAVLVILIFLLSVRATLVTAISIPTSVLLTFIGLNFADYTLNMLTLGALTISIGRVVDDSIVVIENIKRHLGADTGGSRSRTIVTAVREVAGAITASTVTTVAVFLPMAFVGGMVGELFRPFAFTVSIALAASLLVSLTIVPVLAHWFLRTPVVAPVRGEPHEGAHSAPAPRATASALADEEEEQRGVSAWLTRVYQPVIGWTLRKPVATLLAAVVVLGGTIAVSPAMKTNFLGEDEQNSVGMMQTLDPGTSLDAQSDAAAKVEAALADIDGVETVQVTMGGSSDGYSALLGGGSDGTISYSITTAEGADQSALQDEILNAAEAIDGVGDFSIAQSGGGMTTSTTIEINVTGPDQETLAEASDALVAELSQSDELSQVESDLATSRPYLSIVVDREAAAEAGLTELGVTQQVSALMQDQQVGDVEIDADSVSVYLAANDVPETVADVKRLPVATATGEQRLSKLATVSVDDGPVQVSTANGQRTVTVSATPVGDDLTSAGTAVTEALEQVDLPSGATASIGGVMSDQSDAFGQLGLALLAAILIVYVVMVATFRSLLQPLLLLISVPFAATGAILLLIATGIPLGVASLIGVLMLVGIVVTNAIVLVDLINQYRERGEDLRTAVTHGSLRRLRPIVMTALATIFALTPMALGITGEGGFISQPLAVVVIGGLLSSTLLTLVVLPTLYFWVERARERTRMRRERRAAAAAARRLETHDSSVQGEV